MKTTRQVIQTLILILGLAGSVAAFVSTRKILQGQQGFLCAPEVERPEINCVLDTQAAAVRGAGVLVLAVAAFAGVTVIFKD